jgi:membrane protease YdiL (CAAX protease family)
MLQIYVLGQCAVVIKSPAHPGNDRTRRNRDPVHPSDQNEGRKTRLLAGVVDGVAGVIGLNWGKSASAFISNPGSQLLTLFVISLVPFFEEMGWRGYAQDRLQETYHALRSSLILGAVWSLWHLPAFFIPGTYHAGLSIGALEFWLFFSGVIALSVVISWIYINTRRSILVMVIFHAMVNLSRELISLSERGETIFTFCWFAAAVAIVVCFGKTMRFKTGKV